MAAFNKDEKDCPLISLHVADVTNKSALEETVNTIIKQWGGIDILINNAGTSQSPRKATLETLSADDLRSLLDLNVVGVHIVTSAVLRKSMLPAKNGKIINISSRAGKVGYPLMSHYCASKFALEGITAALAEEVRDKGIQVNSFSPGLVNTKSFPKPEGRKGVRSADSIDEGLFVLLESGVSGHYMHADELDEVREKNLDDSVALKPISETIFSP
jgi:NAD(P)-dependent dehydrogenase (short-subunit alcohol dehydrogenase family)